MSSQDEYRVEVIGIEHLKTVLNLLREYFYPREALSRGLNLGLDDIMEYTEEGVCTWLEHGTSVGIFYVPTNKLVAVGLSGILSRDNPVTFNQNPEGQNKAEELRSVLLFCEKQYNAFEDPSVDKVFEFAMMTISSEHNGKGLSYKLFDMSQKLAKKYNCQLLMSQSTGLGSQHIFIKCGFKCVKKLPYSDIEVNGKKCLDVARMGKGEFVGIFIKDIRDLDVSTI